MSTFSSADTKLEVVSTAMSQLLSAYPGATSTTSTPQLCQAISKLGESGIQVRASAQGLMFRFDKHEGFSGAKSRIKLVQSCLSTRAEVAAWYFVPDVSLLTKLPLHFQLPSEEQLMHRVWMVKEQELHSVPKYFSRYTMLTTHDPTPAGPVRAGFWPVIKVQIPSMADKEMGEGIELGWSIKGDLGIAGKGDTIDRTQSIATEVQTQLQTDWRTMAEALANCMSQTDTGDLFAYQAAQGNISGACRVLCSLSHRAAATLGKQWAVKDWTFESEREMDPSLTMSPDSRAGTDEIDLEIKAEGAPASALKQEEDA